MRAALRLLVVASLLPAALVASSAFNAGQVVARTVSVTVTGDASAYLSVQANSASPSDCFVTESATTGKLAITFSSIGAGCPDPGAGTGVNSAGATNQFTRYAFHKLLLVTNKGTQPAKLWVNASSTSGEVRVAKLASGTMVDADYYTTSASYIALTVGSTAYVGVSVNSTTLSSGSISGEVHLVARR